MRGREGGTTRGQEDGATRGDNGCVEGNGVGDAAAAVVAAATTTAAAKTEARVMEAAWL